MIKTRLFKLVTDAKKYIAADVVLQWISLISNVVMVYTIAKLINSLYTGEEINYAVTAGVILAMVAVRIVCTKLVATASYYASKSVKKNVRGQIYKKLLKLGASYSEDVSTAEVVQLAGEGVEQLETYFGNYLPHNRNTGSCHSSQKKPQARRSLP